MTELTINEIYAIGAPIVLLMILAEVVFSSSIIKIFTRKTILYAQ